MSTWTGSVVHCVDPHGFEVDLIHGMQPNERLEEGLPRTFDGNYASERESNWSESARSGSYKRVTRTAGEARDYADTSDESNNESPGMSAHVMRLGHLVVSHNQSPLLVIYGPIFDRLLVILAERAGLPGGGGVVQTALRAADLRPDLPPKDGAGGPHGSIYALRSRRREDR